MATYLGFIIAGLSAVAAVIVVLARLFMGTPFFGQATTLAAVLFMGGVQLITLGIIGEYLGRIYDEVKGRPLYVVREAMGFDTKDDGATSREGDEVSSRAPSPR
jgi:dolichol-phosphate mannosyltransferase